MPDLPNLRRSDRKRRLVEILDRYFLNTPARNENVEVPALTIQTNESDPLPSLAPILMTSYLRHTMSMKRTETVTEDSDESKPKKLSEAPQDAEKTHHATSEQLRDVHESVSGAKSEAKEQALKNEKEQDKNAP